MKTNQTSQNSKILYWGIFLVSFFCIGLSVDLLNSCNEECAANLVDVIQSYPAENSFHRIDITAQEQSFLPVWKTSGI